MKKIEVEVIKEQTPEQIIEQKKEQDEMFRQLDESIKNMKIEKEEYYEI